MTLSFSMSQRSPQWANLVLGIGCLALTGCDTQSPAVRYGDATVGAMLELNERWAMPLPASAQVVGGAILGEDQIAYWTPTDVWLITRSLRITAPTCQSLLSMPRAVAKRSNGAIEILDARGVVVVSKPDRCVRRINAGAGMSISAGALAPNGWSWMATDSAGKWSLAAEDSALARGLRGLTTDTAHVGKTLLWRNTSVGIVLANVDRPHEWTLATANAAPKDRRVHANYVPRRADSSEHWMTTGLVELDSMLLQVLADVKSDSRSLLLFRFTGELVRMTMIDLPFGVLDSDRAKKTLLGIRRPDSLELVLYSWGWRTSKPKDTRER